MCGAKGEACSFPYVVRRNIFNGEVSVFLFLGGWLVFLSCFHP
jgi:hypothetical protein